MSAKRVMALPLLIFAAACGGDNGSPSTPITLPTSPSPTPTPVPTPTPSFDYTSIFDFSKAGYYTSPVAEVSHRRKNSPDGKMELFQAFIKENPLTAQLELSVNPLSFNLWSGDSYAAFKESDADFRSEDGISLFSGNNSFVISRIRNEPIENENTSIYKTEYVAISFSEFRSSKVVNNSIPYYDYLVKYFIFGKRTNSNDIPKSSSLIYHSALSSSIASSFGAGFSAFDKINVDFVTNKVVGSFSAYQIGWTQGYPQVTANLSFTGTIDPKSNTIKGEITSRDSAFRGFFTGSLFGPRGREIGLLFALNSSEGGIAGSVVGAASR